MGHNASAKHILRKSQIDQERVSILIQGGGGHLTPTLAKVANRVRMPVRPFGAPPVSGKANPQRMREEINYGHSAQPHTPNGQLVRRKSNAGVTPGNAGESGQ
jgi:hypothetical protein